MIANRRRPSCVALLALALTMGMAQTRAHAQIFMSPDEVRDCICREQALQGMREENDAVRTQLDDTRAQIQDLQTKIDNMRKTMNPNDSASVQALSQLIGQRDTLNSEYRATILPQAWDSTSKLNAAVGEYNQRCTGRSMRNIDVENARQNPVCPASQ
jgi:TolA-binding protein